MNGPLHVEDVFTEDPSLGTAFFSGKTSDVQAAQSAGRSMVCFVQRAASLGSDSRDPKAGCIGGLGGTFKEYTITLACAFSAHE